MPKIQPAKNRHTFQIFDSIIIINIPSPKNSFRILFLLFWLITFAPFVIIPYRFFIPEILDMISHAHSLSRVWDIFVKEGLFFIFSILIIFTAVELFLLFIFFWQIIGKEIIIVSQDTIKIKKSFFGMGKVKEYTGLHIKNLRASANLRDNHLVNWSNFVSDLGLSGGRLIFDYGSKTNRFGIGIEEAEAKQIYNKIIEKYPKYGEE